MNFGGINRSSFLSSLSVYTAYDFGFRRSVANTTKFGLAEVGAACSSANVACGPAATSTGSDDDDDDEEEDEDAGAGSGIATGALWANRCGAAGFIHLLKSCFRFSAC